MTSSSSSSSAIASSLVSSVWLAGATGPHLERLPDDCQWHITQFLDWTDHFSLRLVCKELLRICLSKWSWSSEAVNLVLGLRRVLPTDEQSCKLISDVLRSMPGVPLPLRWSACKDITDTLLQCIANVPDDTLCIGVLWLRNACRISSASFEKFFGSTTASLQFSAIHELDLQLCYKLNEECLAAIARLSTLTTLNISRCSRITSEGLASLSLLHFLQSLDLSYCDRITDQGLASLSTLQSLQELRLVSCGRITNQALLSLGMLLSLQKLDLSQCKLIDDRGLDSLSSLPSLVKLNLAWCQRITGHGLAKLVSLKELRLTQCTAVTDQGLDSLRSMSDLQELCLRGCCHVTTQGLASLSNSLHSLKELHLNGLITHAVRLASLRAVLPSHVKLNLPVIHMFI